MPFWSRSDPNKHQVDIGDLQNEKQNLTAYLERHLKVEVTQEKDNLAVDSVAVSMSDLHHALKKFIYHRSLNTTHYLTIEGLTIKVNRFKEHTKKKKNKKEPDHESITQSWGL